LHVKGPGIHIPQGVDVSAASTGGFSQGAGNLTFSARVRVQVPPLNSQVAIGLGDDGTNEIFVIYVGRDALTQGYFRFSNSSFDLQQQPISPSDITGDIILRLSFDDAQDLASAAVSLDGGTTFLAPFAPHPFFRNSVGSFVLIAQQTLCGDGLIESGEECDDGNLAVGDGCNSSCAVEPGFICTGQPSVCAPPFGGCAFTGAWDFAGIPGVATLNVREDVTGSLTGNICIGTDPLFSVTGTRVGPNLSFSSGFPLGVGTMIDCNSTSQGTFFSPLTRLRDTYCGDGTVQPGEACDDGNFAGGDGCSPCCQIEECFTCTGEPSTCTPTSSGGSCDDGIYCNGTDTIACHGVCTIHSGDPCPGTSCHTWQESTHQCVDPIGTSCEADGNACTTARCDGAGSCVTFADCEGPLGDPSCTDGVDNDGDGLTDAQDPRCAP